MAYTAILIPSNRWVQTLTEPNDHSQSQEDSRGNKEEQERGVNQEPDSPQQGSNHSLVCQWPTLESPWHNNDETSSSGTSRQNQNKRRHSRSQSQSHFPRQIKSKKEITTKKDGHHHLLNPLLHPAHFMMRLEDEGNMFPSTLENGTCVKLTNPKEEGKVSLL